MNAVIAEHAPHMRRAGWAIVLRGLIALIFGLIAVRYPATAAGAFIIIFAVFAFADAAFDIAEAAAFRRAGLRWGWYALGALISIAAGVLALAYPGLTFVTLVLLIALRAIVLGIVEIGGALSPRLHDHRGLLGIAGVVSVLFGILLFVNPARGALVVLWTIGVYAMVIGVMQIGLGLRMVSTERRSTDGRYVAA